MKKMWIVGLMLVSLFVVTPAHAATVSLEFKPNGVIMTDGDGDVTILQYGSIPMLKKEKNKSAARIYFYDKRDSGMDYEYINLPTYERLKKILLGTGE